jgi:hypothetical protein
MVAMETENKKRHADFQSSYRRSSNFRNVIKKERLEITEDGAVKLKDKKD